MDPKLVARIAEVVAGTVNPSDVERSALLTSLREEEFWSQRGPKLDDEVRALREVETHARAAALTEAIDLGTKDAPIKAALMKADGVRWRLAQAAG